ncbi:alpha/beta hydrolase [Pseudomonas sp. CFBP 13727]|uniref:alpha/beta hydrolase n=1 Tax=unclassified Pseudomonas TaxID=196821 RepID=UPI0017831056|nr:MULTISPECIES: alpha/beta hydrolase [unclassified Pseudomonas]MBD8624275.1 alpha/beta hydrolase [Pseudomonas sp. CFBP 13727]MBD8732086.1 alpha/beta hydrolase [Pseudomonas sp. CFBP 13710]
MVARLLALAALLGLLSACSGLHTLDAVTASGGYQLTQGVAYGADPRQKLDVYRPTRPLPETPVVVFFYGGTWNSGERGDYRFVAQALAARGLLVVVADYRLYPQVRYPSFLEDGADAVAWTYRNIARYGGDVRRLFVMGHSSGGYNAAMLALDRHWLRDAGVPANALRGWIGLAGPYDFLPIENPEAKPVFFFPDSPPQSQPINQSLAGSPPALLIAATHDSTVDPVRNSEGLARRLRAAGVPVQERYYRRLNHRTLIASFAWPLRWLAPVLEDVERFVKAKPGAAEVRLRE